MVNIRKKTRKNTIKMKETIVNFQKGPPKKKYTAFVRDKKTKKIRRVHFGGRGYVQYRDSTPLKLYKKDNHGDIKRMRRYFLRHSGTTKRSDAIQKEKRIGKGRYTPRLLSHIYLW